MRRFLPLLLAALAHAAAAQPDAAPALLLRPDRVFDGEAVHEGWAVLVRDGRIEAAGPAATVSAAGAERVDLAGTTLMPGLIEGHSHVLLHPYNEASWNDQVLREPEAYRVARATAHLQAALRSGFTTLRDLGSEGAGYADVGLRRALAEGVIAGPRLLVAGPAIVATASYGPRGYVGDVPQGAEEASGTEEVVRAVRRQAGGGADWIKVYADYRVGPAGEALATFAQA